MATTISESTVVTAVRTNLDEIRLNDTNFDSGNDESDLDTIIKQKIPWAYRYVVSNCSQQMITDDMITEVNVTNDSSAPIGITRSSASVTGNILKFIYATSSVWSYPVYEAIYWDTPEYAQLMNAHTTGTSERPKVGIRKNGTTGYYIELYGCSSGKAGYVADPTSFTSGTTTISDGLYAAFLYYVTSLVLLTLHENKHAEDMLAQAIALMGVDTSKTVQQ